VSRARPKIADYPFTTLVPNLGLVQYKDHLSFVMADIPGLIEGASEGVGLGHQFLRHVERCKVLIHLVDLGAEGEDREPLKDFDILNRELANYSDVLAGKPQVVAANKMDLPCARERLGPFTEALRERGIRVFPVSTATGEGLQTLMDAAAEVLFTGRTDKLHVEPPPRSRAAAKPAAKKAPAGKAPAKVAARPAAKKGAAKKAPAKVAAKKVAARKAPAKAPAKAVVKKAAAKKVAAKKVPAKKAAAPRLSARKPVSGTARGLKTARSAARGAKKPARGAKGRR
jgi:GTP-binding protein